MAAHPEDAPTDEAVPLGAGADLGRAAIERRIAARLFGESTAPVTLGRFRVLDTLGSGGMGVVYAAFDDKLGRKVAVKVIRGEAQSAERARLLAEARAQARLAHPDVVQVYEVGEAGDDVFIVMEYVDGVTLDRWLGGERRTSAEVVSVFLAAGRGLAAAHGVGLVHRDIKPGNILIGPSDRVRIADFGLARGGDPEPSTLISDPHAVARAAMTSRPTTASVAGTPAYMAPEQFVGRADAQSDQFSFCVALFEGLCGYRPHDLAVILAGGPPPSLEFPRGAAVPRWLRRILATGLAFAPTRRFAGMEALLAALEAGLRRGQRRRVSAMFGLGLAAALAAGAMARGAAPRCVDDPQTFVAVWDDPRRDQVTRAIAATGVPYAGLASSRVAAAFDEFTAQWHQVRGEVCEAGVGATDGPDPRVICLDRARRALAERVALLTRADATAVGAIDEWLATLPKPSHCLESMGMSDETGIAIDDVLRARLDLARSMQRIHRGREGLPLIDEVLAVSQATADGAAEAAEAEALMLRARVESEDLGEGATALHTLNRAYDRATAAKHDVIVWRIWDETARVHIRLEQAETARPWHRRARSAYDARSDRVPVDAAELLDTEAEIAVLEGRFDLVLNLRRDALDLRRQHLPPDHPEIAAARNHLANALAESGLLREALALQEQLRVESTARWSAQHPMVADLQFNLGLTYLELEDLVAARSALHEARAVFVAVEGEEGGRVASTDLYLAQIALAEERFAEAETRGRSALTTLTRLFPRAYSERIAALALLAELSRLAERHADTLRFTAELLAIQDATGLDLDLPGLLTSIGDNLCLLDRCGEALLPYNRLAEHFSRHPPEDPALRAYPLQGMGRAHLALGHAELALPLFEHAYRLLAASPMTSPELFVQTLKNLALSLDSLRIEARRARRLRAQAAAISRTLGEAASPSPGAEPGATAEPPGSHRLSSQQQLDGVGRERRVEGIAAGRCGTRAECMDRDG